MITDTPPAPPELASLHLAKTGRFTDMHGQDVTLSPDLLAQLAASYDPAIYSAPLVIGHPKTNSPAFGHLAKLELTPEGLFGEPINVDPAFAEAVTSGRYPQRSLSFWPADHPSSPTPGKPYIRHLGVLGAVPPAIPGLLGADLAGDDAVPTLTYSPPPAMSTPTMPDNNESIDLAARVAELATKEATLAATQAELERRAAELAEQEANARRAKVIAFCEGLASETRIHPSAVPALAEILVKLDADEPALCFAAADDPETPQAGVAWLKKFLSHLPPLVDLATFADKNRAPAPEVPALNINAIYAARREAQ